MQWDKISTPGCRNSGCSPSAELQLELLSTSLHNWKFGSPREMNLAARSPPHPSHKLPGSKLQAQNHSRMGQQGWFSTQNSRKNRLWPFVTPWCLTQAPAPKHLSSCRSQASPPGCFRRWEHSTAPAAPLYFLPHAETHLRTWRGEVER